MARILVVDDDAPIRRTIEAILETEGYAVSCAADGRAAIEAIEASAPDLVVLDIAMPEMDGWHVLEELHARGLRAAIRVLLMSGRYDRAEVARIAPSDRFLPKPFAAAELLRLVADLLATPPDELYVRANREGDLARLIERMNETLR